MIYNLPFDVVFISENGSQNILESWKAAEIFDFPYYETDLGSLHFSILTHKEEWYLKITNTGSEPVAGFAGIRFPWSFGDDSYTLIPGIYYNGNYQKDQDGIRTIHLPESTRFESTLSAASFPTVLVKDGTKGYHYSISPSSAAGWNGVALDAAEQTLTIFAPAKETDYYTYKGGSGFDRPAYTWQPRTVVCVRFGRHEFTCNTVSDLFAYHWDKAIRSEYYPARNTPKVSEAEGAAIVRDWIYNEHAFFTDKNEPILMNAFMNLNTPKPDPDAAEWNTMIGWCSGSMTVLPLLKFGGKYRDFAIAYLDFLSTHGNSPCGVKYPVYDGNEWMHKNHPQFKAGGYKHCRFYGDYLYYLGKCYRFEKENGTLHPTWEADFRHGLDILVDLWTREKDFGMYWDLYGESVQIEHYGTCAGAFNLLAMAEGVRQYPDDVCLKECFQEACRTYYEKYILIGHSNGGPKDIKEADDSESIAALSDVLTQQYQLFGKEEYLEMALRAARIFATWVVNYQPTFPGGSTLEGLNVCGGVLANVQNHHIGPGICTNSARFVYDLGEITQDKRWTDLYYRIKAAALNSVTTYDGEFFGTSYDQIFLKGMVSEQLNICDALNAPGETWRVSASWPATNIMLSWYDSPNM